MRTLCKKALALCVVFALALTCFVGTLSVSAADVSFDANVSVNASPVAFGDTTATAVFHFELADKTTGINEALIKLASEIGTVAAPAELVKADGTAYSEDELSQLNYAINYVTTDGQDIADDFSNVANLGDFFLSAKNAEYFITEAFIKVTFKIGANVSAGTYAITIDAPEGKVLAASPSEDIINLKFAGANFTVTCDHANATEDVTTAPTCTEPGVKTITCACGYTTTEAIPETGHAEELTYTSNDDGTHAVDCPNCEDVFEAEDCADEDANGACDKCGYVMTPEVPAPTELALGCQHTLSLGSKILIKYTFRNKEGLSNSARVYAVVTKERYADDSETDNMETVIELNDKLNAAAGTYTFDYDGLTAKEMGKEVTTMIYGEDADGNIIFIKNKPDVYSVVSYSLESVGFPGNDEKAKKCLADMFNYGTAAQKYFGYNTSDLVSERTTIANYIDTYETKDSLSLTSVEDSLGTQAFGVNTNLSLNSSIDLIAIVNPARIASYDINNIKVVFSWYDTKAGASDSCTVYANSEDCLKGSTYNFYCRDLAAAQVSAELNIAVYNGDEQISKTKVFSIESYCAKNDLNTNNADLAQALMKYGKSAASVLGY